MRRSVQRVIVVLALVAGAVFATQAVALAAPPEGPATGPNGEFLCPAVGNETAATHNGQGWGGLPNGNYTFLPGNNQAGANANANALNTLDPASSPGPGGGNSDWSPIWPYSPG